MTAVYSIAYGRTKEHAEALRCGLAALPSNFLASICSLCHGEGERKQVYTAGCGYGAYLSTGGCDYCDGTGLLQGSKPAPRSVLNQVLVAAGWPSVWRKQW